MKILIIGGSGFIGTNLINCLLDDSFLVYNIDIQNSFFIKKNKNYTYIFGKFENYELIHQSILNYEIDIVINMVTNVFPGDVFDLRQKNRLINSSVKSHSALIDVLNKSPIKLYVYFSSGGTVYGSNNKTVNSETDVLNPISLYGYIKVISEKLIIQNNSSKYKYLIIRPSNPYGYYQNYLGKQGLISVFLGRIISEKPLEIWGDGSVIRDYVFIDDLSKIIIKLFKNISQSEIVNIGSGKGYSINDILSICIKITNTNPVVKYITKREFDIPENILDISRLEKIIGEYEYTQIDEGILKTWQWINEEYKNK